MDRDAEMELQIPPRHQHLDPDLHCRPATLFKHARILQVFAEERTAAFLRVQLQP